MNKTVKKLAHESELINGIWAVPETVLQQYTDSLVREVLRVQSKLIMVDGVNGYHLETPTKAHFGVK